MKQIKTFEVQVKKQVEGLEVIRPNIKIFLIKDAIPVNTLSGETKNELNEIKEKEKAVDRENIVYRTNEYIYSFKNVRTINYFGRDIYYGTITQVQVKLIKFKIVY